MVGSGAMAAGDEVLALARRLQAPVVAFRGGKGVISDENPYAFNCAEGYVPWADTDVVVGIGSRMELMWQRWGAPPPGLQVVLVDIDPEQRTRLGAAAAVVADAAAGAQAILDALPSSVAPADRRAEFTALKAARQVEIAAAVQPHVAHLAAIRRALPRDGFFVEEVCQVGFTSFFAFPVYEPRSYVTNGCQGALGFGVPTSLGVKAAFPDRAVVAVTGDGGFLFGANELATAVQHRLGVVTIVFNNDAYGNVLNDQRKLFDGRTIGSELRNPDFVALAKAFGAEGCRAETPDELEKAVLDGIDRDGPTVIEVPMPLDASQSPWPFLMPQRTGAAR
jgi:acetolactate synthase-1/2/3 large subunit